MDSINISNIILLIFIYFLSIPLIIYYTYRFYQKKSSKTVLYRQPLLIVCLNLFVISNFVFDRTPRYITSIVGSNYPRGIQLLITSSTSYGIINLLSLKSYLLFYQHRYHTAFQNKTWAKSLNDNWDDWYIRNKNKWGNFSYLLKWLFIPVCILTPLITTFGESICGFTFNIALEIIITLTPILLLLVCVIKLGHFYDCFGIRREMLIQCLMFLIGIAIYFPIIFVSHKHLSEKEYNALYEITQGILIFSIFSILAISSTYYPLYLIQKHDKKHQINLSNNNYKQKPTDYQNILRCFVDYQMFQFFMNHLVKEFATESALFVVEWCQIKNAYQIAQDGVINITNADATDASVHTLVIDLSETLPPIPLNSNAGFQHPMLPVTSKSNHKMNEFITTYMIETEAKNIDNMLKIRISQKIPETGILKQYPNNIKLQVKALYDKYISDNSNTQINIPFSLKNAAMELMLKLDAELLLKFHPSEDDTMDNSNKICDGDLWIALDDICINILGLLLGPYSRFKLGNQYIDYVNSAEYKSKMENMCHQHANVNTPAV